MFIIGIEFTSGEKLVDTDLVGFFKSEEAAEQWLLNEGYEKEVDELFGTTYNTFIRRDVFTAHAYIKMLENIA
ncbi:preprotein translocase subunit [Lysinibacillus phage vB_LspM-01]|nr:preprotein translocase subunit [Lysinibacillus phage vB_LspM-01]